MFWLSIEKGAFLFFFCLGDYYISRVRAEPASAALRSRTHTTHWWPPPVSVPPQEGQVRNQETPHNTEGLPLFTFAEGPSVFFSFVFDSKFSPQRATQRTENRHVAVGGMASTQLAG
jgi:hypothetical protein